MTSEGSQIWLVFNELSARVPAPTVEQGRQRMHDMVSAVATMMSGHPATFVTVGEPNLWAVTLAAEYTVANWLSETDPDRKRFLLTIASKYGFPVEVDEALRVASTYRSLSSPRGMEPHRKTAWRQRGSALPFSWRESVSACTPRTDGVVFGFRCGTHGSMKLARNGRTMSKLSTCPGFPKSRACRSSCLNGAGEIYEATR